MKRLILVGLVAAAAVFWGGCQNATKKEGGNSTAEKPVHEVAAPVVRQPDNSILHPASGMRFPEKVGEFKRATYKQSGPGGLNFFCDYNLNASGAQILVTVSLYPAPSVSGVTEGVIREARPGMADSEYQVEVKRILKDHSEATVTDEKEYSLAQGVQKHVGRYVQFQYQDTIGGRLQPVTSRLYLFNNVDEKWAVRFRLTYPKDFPAETMINSFLTELHWNLRET